jgi:hypothetical protein
VRLKAGRGARVLGVVLVAGVALLPGGARAAGEDPVAEVAAALGSLGPPGVLWGRFAIEEESPAGAWTPLAGVEVTLYPATPTLVADLERIRQSARTSGAQYDSAVARVLAALAVHQARVAGQSPPPPPAAEDIAPAAPAIPVPSKVTPAPAPGARPAGPGGETTAAESPEAAAARPRWRQRTDPAGLFAFEELPSGDWLLVATRVTAYSAEKLRAAPKARASTLRNQQGFTPRVATPAKEAEVWVVRARVGAAERVGLELSDRARWLVGPIR